MTNVFTSHQSPNPSSPSSFSMTFKNGYTVSVAYGGIAYGNGEATAEVAAWRKDIDGFYRLGENDDVIGHQTPEQVLAIMNTLASL